MTRHRHAERPFAVDYTITLSAKFTKEMWGDADNVEDDLHWSMSPGEFRSQLLDNKAAILSVDVDLVEEKGGEV